MGVQGKRSSRGQGVLPMLGTEGLVRRTRASALHEMESTVTFELRNKLVGPGI